MPEPEGSSRRAIALDGEDDVAGFRAAVRRLVAEGVAPDRVSFHVASAVDGDLFGPAPASSILTAASVDAPGRQASVDASGGALPARSPALSLPASFVAIFEKAALHAGPGRFGLLYRLVWRLAREPALRNDPLDADRIEAERMARAVRRDMHKMTAFVRFRPVAAGPAGDSTAASSASADTAPGSAADTADTAHTGAPPVSHVAWFEPEHHIVEATAPFFARRFAQMQWAILTPERSVRWNGRALAFGPGAEKRDAPPADAAEALWLTYYASIFNPARLKLAMMKKEMPRRYWKNLPEAVLIAPLAAQAAERSGRMVEDAPQEPLRRRPAASLALRIDHGGAAGGVDDHSPRSLDALRAATERCRECPIGATATQAVPGIGPAGARLMLVGEQPGDREDLRGLPFVGPAGQLLDRALGELGWPRQSLYLTNTVRHFKFELRGKRRIHKTPAQQEVAACLHWLESEIGLVRPQALVALGATAARALMGRAVGVTAERGRWLVRDDGLPVLVTLHPSALLRMPPETFDTAYAAWLDDLRNGDRPPASGG